MTSEIPDSVAARSHQEAEPSAGAELMQPQPPRTPGQSAADTLLEQASEGLIRKAIEMALSGHAPSLRLCLDRLTKLRDVRPTPFALPKIKGPDDLPTATLALLSAVAVGEITPAEASTLGKLIEAYIQAIKIRDLAKNAGTHDCSKSQENLTITRDMSTEEAAAIYRKTMLVR